ncbi:MAG: glycerate kinase [Alistipes inops]
METYAVRPVQSDYAVLPGNSGKYAAVEAASAVGLYRLDREERNPLRTTSYGVGKVMREAIEAGCTELIAAVGGTATSDCGAGMLAALGCRFLDGQNRLIDYPAGGDLIRFDAIDTAPLYHLTQGCRFKVLCDVDNPLTGPKGAAAVFAGADAAAVAPRSEHFAAVPQRRLGRLPRGSRKRCWGRHRLGAEKPAEPPSPVRPPLPR